MAGMAFLPCRMNPSHGWPDDAIRTTSRHRDSKRMDVVQGLSLVHCIMTDVPVGTQDRHAGCERPTACELDLTPKHGFVR